MRAAVLALVLLAGCLGAPAPSPGASPSSGIVGAAMLGPTCPVVRDPPDPACADKPYNGTLVVTTQDGARELVTFRPDAQGRFNVSVAPGTYAIHRPTGSSMLPTCSSADPVVVSRDHWTLANVSCDTGIR